MVGESFWTPKKYKPADVCERKKIPKQKSGMIYEAVSLDVRNLLDNVRKQEYIADCSPVLKAVVLMYLNILK